MNPSPEELALITEEAHKTAERWARNGYDHHTVSTIVRDRAENYAFCLDDWNHRQLIIAGRALSMFRATAGL